MKVMENKFNTRILTEKQAIVLIKVSGFKFRRIKVCGKTISIKVIGDYEDVTSFLDECIDSGIVTIGRCLMI